MKGHERSKDDNVCEFLRILLHAWIYDINFSAGHGGHPLCIWPPRLPAMWPHSPNLNGAGLPGPLVQGWWGGAHLQLWCQARILEPWGEVEWTQSVWDQGLLSAQLQPSGAEGGGHPGDGGWHLQVQGGLQGRFLSLSCPVIISNCFGYPILPVDWNWNTFYWHSALADYLHKSISAPALLCQI